MLCIFGIYGQDNSAAGACYSGKNGAYFELQSQLQATSYLGGSERIEIEVSGGAYQHYGRHVYQIDSRDGLDVVGFQYGEAVPGYGLKIYDNGNPSSQSNKYILGIQITAGSWTSICVRARELKSRSWITLDSKTPPSFQEVSFTPSWRFKSFPGRFEVDGTIRSKEVKVEASPWPDYVFEPDYNLMSLEETKAFIQEKGHLPGIPTAREVEEEGIALGKINAKLLEKIEELMLHNIKQEETIKMLIERIERLEEK